MTIDQVSAGPLSCPWPVRAPGDTPLEAPPPSRSQHAPPIHRRRVRTGPEIGITRAAVATTVGLLALFLGSTVAWAVSLPDLPTARVVVGQVVFMAGVAALTYGALVHLLARLGALQHVRDTPLPTREALLSLQDRDTSVTVLVPSYREDPRLVRMTLLSAALQAAPEHRVVLLIDDPPAPTNPDDRASLQAARRLPGEVQRALDEPARYFAARERALRDSPPPDPVAATRLVARLHDEAAAWFELVAAELVARDHVEAFVRQHVLERPASQHRTIAAALRWRAQRDPLDGESVRREHRRLTALFTVEMASFERKQIATLSHDPNKAMNLNSYMQLLGTTSRVEPAVDGGYVLTPDDERGTFSVPDADFLVTLDADSILLPGYIEHLLHVMGQPGNEGVALVQTPYSAFPHAPEATELVAGATTDVMCLVHQGATRYDAAYWVGANAMLRTTALRDVAHVEVRDGRRIVRFIQDRTLTEDTDSTIDLVRHGWRVVNHPARLAFSATPPDFGSLLIQRRRWANGGLLILPRLLADARRRPLGPRELPGLLLKVNYLTSLALVNVAFLVLMAFSFEGVHAPVWLPLLSVPYFALYARDLVQAGYRASDLVRVYALTLLLIPVHLGGVARSVQQAVTGRRTAFARTPKVPSRTPVPALYVLAVGVLLVHWSLQTVTDLGSDRNGRAVFTALHVALLAYAVTRFLGWRAAVGDLWLRVTGRPVGWGLRPPGRPRSLRPVWRRPAALLGRVALVPVLLVGAVTAVTYLRMENAPVDGLSDVPFPRMHVLVAGTDSRAELSPERRQELSLGNFEGNRTDTLFVMSLDGDRAAMLAFPRDMVVDRCDGSRGRINAALEIAGPSCLVDTVEAVSGIPISHYVEVDVTGLVDVVDAMGGVTMTLEEPIVDDKTDSRLPAGTQTLDGREALGFVRVRSIDSDLGRIERQQEFVRAMARRLLDLTRPNDPVTPLRVLHAASAALTVDRDAGPVDLLRLGLGASRAVAAGDMRTQVVPTRPLPGTDGELLAHDPARARPLFRAFADGSVLAQPAPR